MLKKTTRVYEERICDICKDEAKSADFVSSCSICSGDVCSECSVALYEDNTLRYICTKHIEGFKRLNENG